MLFRSFLIILPACEPGLALSIAERMRRVMSAVPLDVNGVQLKLSLSLGVACTSPAAGDPTSLIHAADQALYRAKAAGRDRVDIQANE